jgi:hypothetical protein
MYVCQGVARNLQHGIRIKGRTRIGIRSEVSMRWFGHKRWVARVAAAGMCVFLWAGKGQSQEKEVAGQYACSEARVAGKVLPCTAPPLSLKKDGHFELHGREGEYLVTGNWVQLNGAVLKSRARIEAGHKIVFRFYNKKGLCEMIYERRVAELGKMKLG